MPFKEIPTGELLPMEERLTLQGELLRGSKGADSAHAGQASSVSALALNHRSSHLSHEGLWQNLRELKDVPAQKLCQQLFEH